MHKVHLKHCIKLSVVANTSNPSPGGGGQGGEAGGSEVQGCPQLLKKFKAGLGYLRPSFEKDRELLIQYPNKLAPLCCCFHITYFKAQFLKKSALIIYSIPVEYIEK